MGRRQNRARPDWDGVWEVAAAQAGLFATEQATEHGVSAQLLAHHLRAGTIERERRGVYRIARLPRGEHAGLVSLWLGLRRQGVFSHETALALHELSDALPDRAAISLPTREAKRRVRYPKELVVHFADVPAKTRVWIDSLPVTSVERTIDDCIEKGAAPELVEQAIDQARQRGLIVEQKTRSMHKRLARGLTRGKAK